MKNLGITFRRMRGSDEGGNEMFEIRHDMHGFYICTFLEAEHEDEGNPSVGFDGRPHFETIEDATEYLKGDVVATAP